MILTQDTIDIVVSQVCPQYTQTPVPALERTMQLAIDAIENRIPGDFVECGTAMGGCSFAMLLVQREVYGEIRRPVWMFDSFEGMSPPSPKDGNHAASWYAETADIPKDVANNHYCIAPFEQVEAGAVALGLRDSVVMRKGWLKNTLPEWRPQRIALLRIDCDWYDPVKCCLFELGHLMSDGAGLIIDDYYVWEGAMLATHEYLSELPWPLKSIPGFHGAWTTVRRSEW